MKHCKIKIEKDVPAKMRDGVTLYADVYRPDADGEFPVLLTRLPYSKIFGLHFFTSRCFGGEWIYCCSTRCTRALYF